MSDTSDRTSPPHHRAIKEEDFNFSMAYKRMRPMPTPEKSSIDTETFFYPTFYNTAFDEINRINKNSEQKLDEAGNVLTLYAKSGNTRMVISHIREIMEGKPLPGDGYIVRSGLSTLNTGFFHKFTEYCLIALKNQTDVRRTPTAEQLTIHADIREFLRLCGKADTKKNRSYIKGNLEDLLNILLYTIVIYKDITHVKDKSRLNGKGLILSWYEKTGKGFNITLSPPFALSMVYSGVSYYPRSLFEASATAYYIGRKLAFNYGMDGNAAPEGAPDEDAKKHIIRIRTLLKECPNLPTEEEAKASRRPSQSIREPIEKALEELFESTNEDGSRRYPVYTDFYLCKSRSRLFTDEELANLDFDSFMDSYVHYTMYEPDKEKTNQRIAKKRKQAEARQKAIEKEENERIAKAIADKKDL